MQHIAFTGKMGSGKSEAAKYLRDEYGYQVLSLASALREVHDVLWGSFYTRERLQKLGNAIRDIDPDTLVNFVTAVVDDLGESGYFFVVDDVRFPNEYWALKEYGFLVVRVTAPRNLRVSRLRANNKLEDESQLEDATETALDAYEFTHRIHNEGTLDEFHSAIDGLLSKESVRA